MNVSTRARTPVSVISLFLGIALVVLSEKRAWSAPLTSLPAAPVKFTISRDDSVYECFPDLALLRSGRLVLVYRESDSHSATKFARLVYRLSDDKGRTWSPKRVLSDHKQENGVLEKWNCPRVAQLSDGRVVILCDGYKVPPGEKAGFNYSKVFFWFSQDEGQTFGSQQETPVVGIVPDKLRELADGTWLIATHQRDATKAFREVSAYRSADKGKTWEGPFLVASREGLELCEASIVRLSDGLLVAYMRENSTKGLPAYKSFSRDGGRTWDGPCETLMDGAHRPVAGLLASGKVMITYRVRPAIGPARNTYAFLEAEASARTKDRSQQNGILLPLDHDRSRQGDTGYTGWVQFADGEILLVNYIVDDAPKAQIRGYFFRESDF